MQEAGMAETTTITIRIPTELKTRLDRLAELTERSRTYVAAKALEEYVAYELDLVESLRQGIEDFEAGRYFTHEEVMAEARETIAKAKRKAKRDAA